MFFFSFWLCWGFLIGNDGLIFYFSVRSPLDACPLLFIKEKCVFVGLHTQLFKQTATKS